MLRLGAVKLRRQTVAHAFGTLKGWMGMHHVPTRTLQRVRTEMRLLVLAWQPEAGNQDHSRGCTVGRDAVFERRVLAQDSGHSTV